MLYHSQNKDSDGDDILWLEVKHYDKGLQQEYQKYLTWLVEHRAGSDTSSRITVSKLTRFFDFVAQPNPLVWLFSLFL